MMFRQLFDPASSTYTYLLADEDSREAVLIDPVRDQLDRDVALLEELGLTLLYTLETHVHADHVTSSGILRERLGSRSVLSYKAGAGCADVTVREGDRIQFGAHELSVLETPGHTDGCLSYYDAAGERVFTGDTLLIRGCGRTDFQQGDSHKLYRSVTQKLFVLPGATQVFPGHDYKGRSASSITEERTHNPRLAGKTEDEFVTIMAQLQLPAPRQIAQAVPANLACGRIQAASDPSEHEGWAPVVRTNGNNVPEVNALWLSQHSSEVLVIDVREADEFAGALGHVENSQLTPLGLLGSEARTWNKNDAIVVVCRSGRRSGVAALELERLGFRRVASLRGGMLAWKQAGLPVSVTPVATAS